MQDASEEHGDQQRNECNGEWYKLITVVQSSQ